MVAPVILIGWALLLSESSNNEYLQIVLLAGSVLTLIAANTLLLRHNFKMRAPAEVSAGVFLVGGNLPGATLLLIAYFPSGLFSGWDMGAYFVLAACIGYVLRIISLMRRGTKAYRPEENPGLAE